MLINDTYEEIMKRYQKYVSYTREEKQSLDSLSIPEERMEEYKKYTADYAI